MTWSSFMRSAPACDHAVQVYEHVDELADAVRTYLDAGFRREQPAVVIATPEHWAAAAARLQAPEGLLTVLDAEETLASLMADGEPSPELFEAVVGGVVDDVAQRFPGRTIRAFGEMVDVLWQRGEREAAIALEDLWNGLAKTRDFALLCAYRLDIFDLEVQRDALPEIFRVHTHARPADPARLAAAVDRAAAESLGSHALARVYLDVAERVPRGGIPRAQALLSTLAEHRPDAAATLLQRARALYRAG